MKPCPICSKECGNSSKICKYCGASFPLKNSASNLNNNNSSFNDSDEEFFLEYDSESSDEENEVEVTWSKTVKFEEGVPFNEEVGLSKSVQWKTELECFSSIWDKTVLENLVRETNRFGSQTHESNCEKVTSRIMTYFLCIAMIFSLAPFRGKLSEVWSRSWISRNDGIAQRFPRELF